MSVTISSSFCGGNIICKSSNDASDIRLEIRKDNASDFYQWFYFRLTGEKGQACKITIQNAGGAAYTKGWDNYRAVASYGLHQWYRVPTSYDGQNLVIETVLERNTVYFAYFAPYPLERHALLVAGAQTSDIGSVSVLGQTLDGRDLDLIEIGKPGKNKRVLWVTARQHPGETMAEWWMEGFLERMLHPGDQAAQNILKSAVLYAVPNMNPDGSTRGHLRTNAAGVNLNREWQSPSLERSPEVFHVLEKMDETGVDFSLDVHGDEALPYNFIAGTEGIPGYTDRLKTLLETFNNKYASANSDFQTKYGYPPNKPGRANMTICSNAVAERFDCLAVTLEMPFKDNANQPDERYGWSPDRSRQLGSDAVDVLADMVDQLR